MGGEPYEYTVPYEPDVSLVLERLREDVFASGDFRSAEMKPSSPEEAMAMCDADGTASILDIFDIAEDPSPCCAAPLTEDELQRYFGTNQPTKNDIEQSDDFWEDIDRGHCRYVILYEGDEPKHIYFAGCSFD